MTDLEIRKLITEIEINETVKNIKSCEFDDIQNCYWVEAVGFLSYPLLNPLTDKALCFDIAEKAELDIEYNIDGVTGLHCVGNCSGYEVYFGFDTGICLQKAICLSYIKKHEEK